MNAPNNLNTAPRKRGIGLALNEGLTAAQQLLEASIPLATQQANEKIAQARIFLEAGRHDAARELCRQILLRDPHDSEAVKLLGQCRFDLSEFMAPQLLVQKPEVFLPIPCSTAAATVQLSEPARKPSNESIDSTDGVFSEEVRFWDLELSLQGNFAEDMRKRAWEPDKVFPREIIPYLDELRSASGRRPRVLDAGSGPLSYLAWGHQQGTIEVVAADPLAPVYLQLLHKHRLIPGAPLVKCFGEELSAIFGAESFDFIYMRNALDHSQCPADVFRELVQVLRPGGYLYLMGTVREATRMNWAGLHQHDLYLAPGGRLMDEHRVPNGSNLLIIECISDDYPIEVIKSNPPTDVSGQWLSIIWRKTGVHLATNRVPASRSAKPRAGRQAA